MKAVHTFSEYLNDESRVTEEERERINFEVSLIEKMIEAREKKGWSQRDLAKICGVKQPAIARIETRKTAPQIDTLLKVLVPLGYTLKVVPLSRRD